MAALPRYRIGSDGSNARRVSAAAPLSGGMAGSMASGYEGAASARRLFAFRPTAAGVNSLLIGAGPMLRARARHLVRNNPYARKARRVFVSNLVGTGIVPQPKLDDPQLKRAVRELWEDWTDEADADGLTDYYGLQMMAAGAMFEAGECFLRKRSRFASDGLSVPLQLQLLESEMCPLDMNMVATNGNQIRAGIEFDKLNRRVAYWFYRQHPGEFALGPIDASFTRVPAEDVIHLFEPIRPGQIRGVSWLAATIVRAWLLDEYDGAELDRKKVAALFAGFIERPDSDEAAAPLGLQDQPESGARPTDGDAPGEVAAALAPGLLQVLLPGEKISFSEPADVGGNYEAFEYRALLALCASMDLPYFAVTGDLKGANYSSLRAGTLDMRRAVEQLQHMVMVFQMCRGTWRRWLPDAVLAGALPIKPAAFNRAPRQLLRVRWQPPRWEWVDPLKDVSAELIAMRAGIRPRSDVIASMGEDRDAVDERYAEDAASGDSRKLVFDSDPRRTDKAGSAVAQPDQFDAETGDPKGAGAGATEGSGAGGGGNRTKEAA